MLFNPFPGTRKEVDLLTGIAPVPDRSRIAHGGAGWHWILGHQRRPFGDSLDVVAENIGMTDIDRGPIFAIQTFADLRFTVRNFSKTDKHPEVDLALGENGRPGTSAAPYQTNRETRFKSKKAILSLFGLTLRCHLLTLSGFR